MFENPIAALVVVGIVIIIVIAMANNDRMA
jgi:hypothetical protein